MTLSNMMRAFESDGQPEAIYHAAAKELRAAPGFKLFTILVCQPEERLVRRIYTSNPDAYPVGGAKPMQDSAWSRQVVDAGKPYVCRNREDIQATFGDYELIWALGCEGAINVPVRWCGKTLATLNLLHEADYYREEYASPVRLIGQLCLPGIDLSLRQLAKASA
jgi:hypothetical protein